MSSTRLRSRSDRQDRGGPGPLSTGGETHGTGSEEVDNRINSIVDQENNPAYRSLAMSKAGGSKRTDNSSDNNSEMLNVNCVKQESDVKLPNENNVKMEDSTETVGEDHNIRRGGSSGSPTEHSVQGNFPSVAEFDEYGFQIDDDHAEYPRSHNYTKRETGGEDAGKWASLLSDDQWQRNQQSGGKVRSYIQKGVPAGCRGRLWMRLLDIDMLAMNANFSYKANLVAMREQLVEMGICEFKFAESLNVLGNMRDSDFTDKGDHSSMKYIDPVTLRQIFCDIERTYPSHEMFSSRSPRGQEGCATLLRILAVYARYNKQVGYCQGMSYIAGLLLMQMGEVEAFWCLVALFERPKYLQGFYNDSLGKMKNYAAVFKKLLSERLPALTAHVRSLQLQPMMFLTPWFLGLYTELPCWDTVLAIWDLFLLDGSVTVLRVAMAIMEVFESELMLSCDLSTLLPGLLHLPTHVCNYETLVPVIWGTVIEPWEVNSLLAVVSEEEAIRQQRKRALSEDCVDMAERSKRPRVEASQNSPSIFRRLLNFFTGKSESNTRRLSHSRRMMRRAQHARLARRRPVHLPSHLLSSEDFGGTPGTPTEDTENIRAREEFSFRMFNTPVPVRRSQARQVRLPLMEANSPDVELEAMSLTGFGKSSGNEAP